MKNPDKLKVRDVKCPKVLYCYADQDISEVVRSMQAQQVWRLVLLDNKDEKQMSGVISVGDILRAVEEAAATAAAREIARVA